MENLWQSLSACFSEWLPTIRLLLSGLRLSALLFASTLIFALPLGLLIALGRMSRFFSLRSVVKVLISIVRGTPLMLQLMVVYYGPNFLFDVNLRNYPALLAAVIAFSFNYACYFAEIYRSGIESIPRGQYEAAQVLGYSRVQTFCKIIMPQVLKRILPPITNEVITLVKDTSLAQIISVIEMFTTAKQLANATSAMMPLVIAGVFYYVFNFIVAFLMEWAERKMSYYR